MSQVEVPLAPARATAELSRATPAAAWVSVLARQVGLVLANAALAVFHTWPLAARWRTDLLGGEFVDPWMNAWHLAWMREAATSGRSPYFAPTLHHPLGAELYWHTLVPAKTAWGAMLVPRLGTIGAYNALVFTTFVLTGLTTYWFLGDVLRRAGATGRLAPLAAFVGAAVFNFSRYHLCHATAHLNLASLEGIPLFLLFFFRYVEDAPRRRWLVGAALSAAYVSFCDFYYVYYLALFCAAWLVFAAWRTGPILSRETPRSPRLRRAAGVAVAALLGCAPAVAPLLLHLSPAPLAIHHGDSEYPLDPLLLAVPDAQSAWRAALPAFLERPFARLQEGILGDVEGGVFLGLLAPVLAVVGLRRAPGDDTRTFARVAIAFALLSLGPYLHIGGEQVLPAGVALVLVAVWALGSRWLGSKPYARDVRAAAIVVAALSLVLPITAWDAPATFRLPMPYLFFKHMVPLFGRGGMPVRFLLMTQLCLAALAALGAYHALRAARGRAALAFVGLVLVSAIEMKSRPMPTSGVRPAPAVFETIRADGESAVLTDHVIGQWEQTQHGRPVSHARQSRLPTREADLVRSPLVRAVERFEGLDADPAGESAAAMRAQLGASRYRYFVAHVEAAEDEARFRHANARELDVARRAFVERVLRGRLVFDDGARQVYTFW